MPENLRERAAKIVAEARKVASKHDPKFASSPLATAAIALMEARSYGMLTSQEWDNLRAAVQMETGSNPEWRTYDELKSE
jgi:hypothetical protein